MKSKDSRERYDNDIVWFLIVSGILAIMWFGAMLYALIVNK